MSTRRVSVALLFLLVVAVAASGLLSQRGYAGDALKRAPTTAGGLLGQSMWPLIGLSKRDSSRRKTRDGAEVLTSQTDIRFANEREKSARFARNDSLWKAPEPANFKAQAGGKKDVLLKAADITPKIFPETVFYRGKVGTVQMRNTGGVHFSDDFYLLAGLVDTSGYSSSVKEKYQGYLMTEVPIEINGQSLKAGAYGIGFLEGSKFFVTDIGGNRVLEVKGQRDSELKRPTPLQVTEGSEAGAYRLYLGRDFVTIKRAS